MKLLSVCFALVLASGCSSKSEPQATTPGETAPASGDSTAAGSDPCAALGGATCGEAHMTWTTGKDGCCFETTQAACESLGCSADSCDILESAPQQANCRAAAEEECPKVLDCEPPTDDPRCEDPSFRERCPDTVVGL